MTACASVDWWVTRDQERTTCDARSLPNRYIDCAELSHLCDRLLLVNKHPTGVDYEESLSALVTNPEQSISTIYTSDGAGLYKITDDHYVCVECIRCYHQDRALLERVLPQDWECFSSAVNSEDGFEIYHYGPPA